MWLDDLKRHLQELPSIIGKQNMYLNAAVLLPLVYLEEQWQLLYHVRSETISQGGEVAFPGGRVEMSDLNVVNTAIRETCEELGIEKDKIDIIGSMGTLLTPTGITIDAIIGVLDIRSLAELSPNGEVSKVFLVPINYLLSHEPRVHQVRLSIEPHYVDEAGNEVILLPAKELGLPLRYHRPWGVGLRSIYFYEYKGYQIWGMTGELTFELIHLLKKCSIK